MITITLTTDAAGSDVCAIDRGDALPQSNALICAAAFHWALTQEPEVFFPVIQAWAESQGQLFVAPGHAVEDDEGRKVLAQ